jgi:hypothetical protein
MGDGEVGDDGLYVVLLGTLRGAVTSGEGGPLSKADMAVAIENTWSTGEVVMLALWDVGNERFE